jgi:hypothetical protein
MWRYVSGLMYSSCCSSCSCLNSECIGGVKVWDVIHALSSGVVKTGDVHWYSMLGVKVWKFGSMSSISVCSCCSGSICTVEVEGCGSGVELVWNASWRAECWRSLHSRDLSVHDLAGLFGFLSIIKLVQITYIWMTHITTHTTPYLRHYTISTPGSSTPPPGFTL